MGGNKFGSRIDEILERVHEVRESGTSSEITPETAEIVEELAVTLEELHAANEQILQQAEVIQEAQHVIVREKDIYQDLFVNAPVGYVVTDSHGIILDSNLEALSILHSRGDWIKGRPFFVFLPVPLRSEFRDWFIPGHQPGGKGSIETTISSNGEEDRIVSISSNRFASEGGETHIRLIMKDITELTRAREELETTVTDLKRSNEDLERFAYVASHDLQEPLRMVSSFCQLLQERYAGRLGPDADEFIEYAVSGSHRMQQLITDLLEYSRVTGRPQQQIPVDTHALVTRVIDGHEAFLRSSGGEIMVGDLPEVIGDPHLLSMVFENLISNSLKFQKAGSSPRVEVTATRIDGMWRFSVADNGIGVDPEYYNKIFVIFQRLNSSQRYDGTGLGLAICKRIVERAGGSIWVESELGSGSTFFFTLPATRVDNDLPG